jgi:hypothetical protein
MVDAARRLEAAGADLLLICTNTMHRMAHDVQSAVRIPLIHIADPTAERIVAVGLRKVGLLGRAFTMEQDFYKGRLSERFGLEVIVPDEKDRATVHRIIYDELVARRIESSSRESYRAVIARLVGAVLSDARLITRTQTGRTVSSGEALRDSQFSTAMPRKGSPISRSNATSSVPASVGTALLPNWRGATMRARPTAAI